jgi:hypothetical protein
MHGIFSIFSSKTSTSSSDCTSSTPSGMSVTLRAFSQRRHAGAVGSFAVCEAG